MRLTKKQLVFEIYLGKLINIIKTNIVRQKKLDLDKSKFTFVNSSASLKFVTLRICFASSRDIPNKLDEAADSAPCLPPPALSAACLLAVDN